MEISAQRPVPPRGLVDHLCVTGVVNYMARTHYQLLARMLDEHLRTICARRKLPFPNVEDGPDGLRSLLRSWSLPSEEDNKQLTNTLADLDGALVMTLKNLVDQDLQPSESAARELADADILPSSGRWTIARSVWPTRWRILMNMPWISRRPRAQCRPVEGQPFGFSLALTSVLLRCMGGIRERSRGLPAKEGAGPTAEPERDGQ